MRRLMALGSVALLACPSGRDALIANLQAKRPEERAVAVKKLAAKFDNEDVPLFTQAARDPSPLVRGEAMAALGKSQDPRVVDLLAEALGDADARVQESAAKALASIRSDKARSYLALQYGRRARDTRMVIVEAMKSTNTPGAMAQVIAAEASSTWDRNLKALTTGSAPERAGAAEVLGRSGRPEAVDRLVALLKDPQIAVAAAAARGLGHAGDARAVPSLTALLKESAPELREAGCEALGALQAEAALPELLEVAKEKSPASLVAVGALVALPPSAASAQALCELTASGPSHEATAAGREMRRRGGCPLETIAEKLKNISTVPGALGAILALGPSTRELSSRVAPLLTAGDSLTRHLAADALAELGDASAIPALLKAYEAEVKSLEPVRGDWVPAALPLVFGQGFDPDAPSGEDPASVTKARQAGLFRRVDALAKQKAEAAGKMLVEQKPPRELIDDSTEEQVQGLAALVRALGRLKASGHKDRVEPWLNDASPSLRAAAFSSMAALGDIDAARRGLTEPERDVQAQVASALVEAGEAGQTAVLQVAVSVSDRSRMLEALRDRPLGKSSVELLTRIMQEGGGDAGLAALAIADAKGVDAAPIMVKLLADPTTVARRDLVVALGRLGQSSNAEAVAKELFSDAAAVRAAAAESLGALGAASAVEPLDALKGDYSLQVRNAAAAALTKLGANKVANPP
jgi:cellulose synthase operon protein C